MAVRLDIEPVGRFELQEVQRCEIARRVIEEHVLGARVRGADLTVDGAGVPLVRGVVELQPGIGAEPGCLADVVPQVPRAERPRSLRRPAVGLRLDQFGAVVEAPGTVRSNGLHEVVGDANRVVRVLPCDRQVGLALPVGVVLVDLELPDPLPCQLERSLDRRVGDPRLAGRADCLAERRVRTRGEPIVTLALAGRCDHHVQVTHEESRARDQGRDLRLLDDLPADELLDVGVIEIERHHLRGTSGRSAGLDRPGSPVTDLEEAHQTARASAAGERLVLAAEGREVRARARAVLEDPGLSHPEVHDPAVVDQVIGDRLDETGVRGGALVRACRSP